MKKLGILIGVFTAFAFAFVSSPETYAAATPVYDTTGVYPRFYANGTPITIDKNSSNQTIISWSGAAGTCGNPCIVANNTEVYGGYLNDSTVTTSSITMNGGTVDQISGGGVSTSNPVVKSHVTKATITINGGTVAWGISGGGIMGSTANAASSLADSSDPAKAINVVDEAIITIGASVNPSPGTTIYGGGISGFNYVGKVTINVAGGKWWAITAGGSNGYVGEAVVNVSGGTFNNIHGNNHGDLDKFTLNMTGGTITTGIYAGADCNAANSIGAGCDQVKGGLGSAELNITGGDIAKIDIGYNKDSYLGNIPAAQDAVALNVLSSAIIGTPITGFSDNSATGYFITIDGKTYLAEAGKALSANSWYKTLTTKDGYNFKGFKTGDVAFAASTSIDASVALTTDWEAVKVNPKTSDNIFHYIALGVVGLIGLGGTIVLASKQS